MRMEVSVIILLTDKSALFEIRNATLPFIGYTLLGMYFPLSFFNLYVWFCFKCMSFKKDITIFLHLPHNRLIKTFADVSTDITHVCLFNFSSYFCLLPFPYFFAAFYWVYHQTFFTYAFSAVLLFKVRYSISISTVHLAFLMWLWWWFVLFYPL